MRVLFPLYLLGLFLSRDGTCNWIELIMICDLFDEFIYCVDWVVWFSYFVNFHTIKIVFRSLYFIIHTSQWSLLSYQSNFYIHPTHHKTFTPKKILFSNTTHYNPSSSSSLLHYNPSSSSSLLHNHLFIFPTFLLLKPYYTKTPLHTLLHYKPFTPFILPPFLIFVDGKTKQLNQWKVHLILLNNLTHWKIF